MNSFLTLFRRLILVFALSSFGGDALSSNSHVIMLDLSSVAVGGLDVQYEYPVASSFRLVFPLSGQLLKLNWLPNELITSFRTFLGFGFLPDAELASGIGTHFELAGFFVEPVFLAGYARVDYPSRFGSRHLMVLRPRLSLGYNSVLPLGVTTSFSVGLSKRFFFPDEAVSQFQPHVNIKVGYAW